MSDSELEEVVKQDYGRLNFRGVPMAYLTLGDQEEKFTLTDVVCNLYPHTPRTTVISRMDKMRIIRTPCTPEQIRKVKAAGGVHSSSVVCSLVSKQAIEAFCDKYPIDVPVGLDSTLVSDKDANVCDLSKAISKPGKKTNVIINPCKDKKGLIKKRRSKRALVVSPPKRSHSAVMNDEECSPLRHIQDSSFAAQPMESCKGCKTASDEKLYGKSFLDSNHFTSQGNSNKKRAFSSASSKISKVIKNGYLPTKRKEPTDSNEHKSPVRKVKKVKIKHSNSEERLLVNERAQSAVNKLNSHRWLVDTLIENNPLSYSPSSTAGDASFSSVSHSKHKNSTSPVKKEPFSSAKDKTKNLQLVQSKKDPNLTSSPPSLILKRQGKRTWHIEQRTIENHSEIVHNNHLYSNSHELHFSQKKKGKKEPTDYCVPDTESRKSKTKTTSAISSKTETEAKNGSSTSNAKRKKIKRNSRFFSSDSFNGAKSADQGEADKKQFKYNGLCASPTKHCEMPMKKKRKRGVEKSKEEVVLNTNQITTKFGKGRVPKLRKIKTEPLDEDQPEFKFSQEKNNTSSLHQFPTPESTPSATPTEVKPAKVVVKLTPVKPKLKTNRKFKFMDIFAGEPSLILKNGDLEPAYKLDPTSQPSKVASQALLSWHLGGRIVGRKNVRYKVHSLK